MNAETEPQPNRSEGVFVKDEKNARYFRKARAWMLVLQEVILGGEDILFEHPVGEDTASFVDWGQPQRRHHVKRSKPWLRQSLQDLRWWWFLVLFLLWVSSSCPCSKLTINMDACLSRVDSLLLHESSWQPLEMKTSKCQPFKKGIRSERRAEKRDITTNRLGLVSLFSQLE
jgi:hypothetical protein